MASQIEQATNERVVCLLEEVEPELADPEQRGQQIANDLVRLLARA